MIEIRLRGHHLEAIENLILMELCPNYQAVPKDKGKHGKRYFSIAKQLISDPNIKVELIDSLDKVCEKCLDESPKCTSTKYKKMDRKSALSYGLKIGRKYNSGYIVSKIRETIKECYDLMVSAIIK